MTEENSPEIINDIDDEEIELKPEKKNYKSSLNYTLVTEQRNRSTINILTEYEYTQCISIRASEIERGHKIFTDYKGLDNPIAIAKKEFNEGNTPMSLIRIIKYKDNVQIIDKWDISKMSYYE